MSKTRIDRPFLIITITLACVGFLIFSSAALGEIAQEHTTFINLMLRQALSLGIGFILLVIAARIPYQFWNRYAFYIFLASIAATLLVFVPGIGFSHGGAQRWINLGFTTFQPAELLKLGAIIYYASWLAGARQRLHFFTHGALPLIVILAVVGLLLALQPDAGTFVVIAITLMAMFFVAGARFLHSVTLAGVGAGALIALGVVVPYIRTRLLTFINPEIDPLGAGYQIKQSLIAVGSGRWFGRGFGQSIQKFNFLPEPIGDSIFAVFAEEWGFIGAFILVALLMLLALRGLKIASQSPTVFSGLLASGIVISIVIQQLINIASMIGLFPLTGMPLLLVSQGGSALITTLLGIGIVLQISQFKKAA